MLGTFALYLASAAFFGAIGGRRLRLQLGEMHAISTEEFIAGRRPSPEGFPIGLLLSGVPAAILGRQLLSVMDPWILFGWGMGAAFVGIALGYFASRN
jgi:hypothetical protein